MAGRMPPGQRTWRQIDVFGVASTQTLGAVYCGTRHLYQQLQQYDTMVLVSQRVVALRAQGMVLFGDIVDAIGKVHLKCYGPGGYWSVHLARIFVPSFSDIPLLGDVSYSPRCATILYKMGSGAASMELLGITEENVNERGTALCDCIVKLARRSGLTLRMELPHLACAVCEAHRRNVLGAGPMSRRPGL